MKIVPLNRADIDEVAGVLKAGGLVIFPSETTYGAAVDATLPEAVAKLNKYKQRPAGKPYSVMVPDRKEAEKYVRLNPTARNLYKKFLPGPVTVVSKVTNEPDKLAPGVAAETGTLGIRIPDYPFLLALLKTYKRPLTATSANASYKKRPYKITDILDNLSEKQKGLIDLIIDAGELPHNEPSTVIDTTMDDPITLRQGKIILGNKIRVITRSEEETRNFGKEMWQKYEQYAGKRAVVLALEGPMGAGKTQFAKGVAKAMGITDEIISPTFNLEVEYFLHNTPQPPLNTSLRLASDAVREGGIKLIHADAWRMANGQELEQLGLAGQIRDKSVLIIEWADRAADIIRKYNEEAVVVWVKIEYSPTGKNKAETVNERVISWEVI